MYAGSCATCTKRVIIAPEVSSKEACSVGQEDKQTLLNRRDKADWSRPALSSASGIGDGFGRLDPRERSDPLVLEIGLG